MSTRIIPDVVHDQQLLKLTENHSARDAARAMADAKVSAVLIVEEPVETGRLVGICTERDLSAKVVARSMDPDTTKIAEVMTRNPDVLAPHDPPLSALELMRSRGYRHLPVVDGDTLVGMVSIRDLYDDAQHQLEEDVRQREAFIFDTGYGAGH